MTEFFSAGTQGSRIGCYYIQTDDTINSVKRPVLAIGKVNVAGTKGRKSPPKPICGFKCEDTPFGKGHIMALQLGGPDESCNIVPQYEQWQQSEGWRKIETGAMTFAKSKGDCIFVARVIYKNNEDNIAPQLKAFRENYTLFDWEDFRIPTDFEIWVLPENQAPGSSILAGIFGANANRATYSGQSLTNNLAAVPITTNNNSQDYWAVKANQSKMPVVERDYWGTKLLRAIAKDVFAEYEADRALQKTAYVQTQQQAARNAPAGAGPIRNSRSRVTAAPYASKTKRQLEGEWETNNPVEKIENVVTAKIARVRTELQTKYGWTQQSANLITGQDMRTAQLDTVRSHQAFQTQGPEPTIALARAAAQAAVAATAAAAAQAAQAQPAANQGQPQVAQAVQAAPVVAVQPQQTVAMATNP